MSGEAPSRLARRLGLGGAVAVGLGAMLGTGVFAAWTPAIAAAGSLVLVALVIAAAVASLNAWSSVRLAATHPVSGGSYSYGRRWLGRPWGVAAGVSFVLGKSASAGAAALTIGAYVAPGHQRWVAAAAVLLVLAVDLRGVVATAAVSAVLSALVIAVLVLLVVGSYGIGGTGGPSVPVSGGVRGLLEAAAVLFVAFAGYARVTVLGEEVRSPARTIPRAVAISLIVVLALYLMVGVVTFLTSWSGPLSAAPLLDVVRAGRWLWLAPLVTAAAVVAAGAALLSLVSGVGRTLFAMARDGDAPAVLGRVSARSAPIGGQVVAAVLALAVVAVGGIGAALALSAGSIGVYYAVAHLSALRMGAGERPPPRWVPVLGLLGCLVLVAGALLALMP